MAKAFINDENLTDIADAIRATLDESRQYLPSEMAAAIQSIPIMAQLNRKKYFQSVPAGAASGYATIEQIKGNTVVWNQLVDTGTTSVVVQSGHVYYANINGTASIATSDGNPISVTGGSDIIHDLTLIFGAGNEPTTVADFEAWMAQNIGTLPYYDYNAGELLSVKMSGMQTNTSKLPLGYQELEYIESTGTQYIDTGIVPTLDYEFEIKAKKTVNRSLIGSGSDDYVFTGGSGINYLYQGARQTSLPNTIDNTLVHTWAVKNGYLYCDSDSVAITNTPVTPSNSFALFARKTGSTSFDNIGTHTIYYAKIWNESDVLVFNGIPAKRLSDGVLGIYNTVTNTFFTNLGTGTFIGGPEVHLDTLLFDVTTITGINPNTNTREVMFASGMKQSNREGTVKDELDLRSDTSTVKVGSRAYQSGDESDTSVITDGTTTYYALTTPIDYTDLQDANGNPLNPRYKVEQGGTEQVLPVNTSTPTTVAPTLSTIYKKA